MVFYKLKIGKYELTYTPLKAEVKEYPYCDPEGNILEKKMIGDQQKRKSVFVDQKGTEHNVAFRLINNKAVAKLDKTKSVSNFREVDNKEVEDLLTEKEYLVNCEFLKSDLINSGKALKFGFTNGNGFKVYKGYIYVDNLYGILFMKLGRTQKSEVLTQIKEIQKNKQQAEKLQLTISGVDKAKIEDLIEI